MANSREPKGDILHHADPKDKDRGEREPLYSTRTGHMERTMFVVDLSRLKAEGDTLESALVLYRPEANIKMQQCEQRCSQLVGMALCTMNFTGNYPEYLKLKGVGYAIRALGDHYLMGLSSRIDEPPASVVNHLKNVHDFFQFYYHSPAIVMKSCQNDWEIFNRSMSQIFHYILIYLAMDQHSVPVMLNPLPYLNTQHCGKNAPRLYLLASRVLRACQQHQSIVGGCIIHNSKILTSQFEPMLTDKLALVGGGGVELNRLSILEDDIAPNKVWVLEVFLSPDEVHSASNSRKDHIAFQAAYASLDTNPHLTTSALNWRFQINSSGGNSVGSSGGISSSTGGNSSTTKQRGNWRNRTTATKSNSPSKMSFVKASHTTPDLSSCTTQDTTNTIDHPVATSTPQSHRTSGDAITMNLAQGSVSYSPSASYRSKSRKGDSPISPTTNKDTTSTTTAVSDTGNKKQQEQEELLYVDAMEDIDPTLLPPIQAANTNTAAVHVSATTAESTSSPVGRIESRPTSTSSEGFSTPPPTPLQDKTSMAIPFKLSDGIGVVSESSSASFKTACDSLIEKGEDKQDGDNSDTLTRDTQDIDGIDKVLAVDLNDSEIEKIVNTPIAASIDANQRSISMISGGASAHRVPTYSAPLRSWNFKNEPVVESDDDSDFVSSTELQEMIMESKKLNVSDLPQAMHCTNPAPDAPPLPPRRSSPKTSKNVSHQEEALVQDQEEAPPRPPKPSLLQKPGVESLQENDELKTTNSEDHDETTSRPTEGVTPAITTANTNVVDSARDVVNGHPEDNSIEHKHCTGKKIIPNGILKNSDEYITTANGAETETAEDKAELGTEAIKSDEDISSEDTPVVNGAPETPPIANGEDVHPESNDSAVKEDSVDQHIDTNGTSSPTETVTESDNNTSNKPDLDLRGEQESSNQKQEGSSQTGTESGANEDTALDVEELDVVFTEETQEGKTEDNRNVENRNDRPVSKVRLPVSESLAGVLQEMGLPIDESIETELDQPSGTVTPVEMTLNESTIKFASQVKVKLEQGEEEGSKLNNSGEYSSAPEDIELDGESLLASEEGSTASLSKSSTLSGYGVGTGSRPRSRSWLAKTMDRNRSMTTPDQSLKSMCLYVQLHMNTMVLLLADTGLHKDHTVLNSLWRSLLPQLLELDAGLKGDRGQQRNSQPKPQNYFATISNYDRYCEALPNTASFQYRHAVRRAHQEYNKDPSLLQISLSKEHVRILSQNVHNREVYFQPGRLGNIDALAMHGAIEKYAKVKSSLRQQPIGGPKVMFF